MSKIDKDHTFWGGYKLQRLEAEAIHAVPDCVSESVSSLRCSIQLYTVAKHIWTYLDVSGHIWIYLDIPRSIW